MLALFENLFSVSAVIVIVVVVFILFLAFARRYKKVGPNYVMIISGIKRKVRAPDGTVYETGFRVRKGGGAFIIPLFETVDLLSLEVMTLDVSTPEVYTKPGVPIIVEGVAQVKIKGDEESIRTAAEQFLGKSPEQVKQIAMQTVEGHLRAIIGTLTVEDIYRNRDEFAAKVQEIAATDLANMGLQIVSFTLKDIRDTHGYLEALGKPRIAQVKRDAVIAEAERDAAIRSAQARQEAEMAKYQAETKIAEGERDYKLKKAEYDAAVNEKKAHADLAYDLEKYKLGQQLKKEEIQITVVEKEQQTLVQEKEIQRREKELEATVKRQADAERYRVQTEAEAMRYKYETEARGQAEARRLAGMAQADVIKATGTAEANII